MSLMCREVIDKHLKHICEREIAFLFPLHIYYCLLVKNGAYHQAFQWQPETGSPGHNTVTSMDLQFLPNLMQLKLGLRKEWESMSEPNTYNPEGIQRRRNTKNNAGLLEEVKRMPSCPSSLWDHFVQGRQTIFLPSSAIENLNNVDKEAQLSGSQSIERCFLPQTLVININNSLFIAEMSNT